MGEACSRIHTHNGRFVGLPFPMRHERLNNDGIALPSDRRQGRFTIDSHVVPIPSYFFGFKISDPALQFPETWSSDDENETISRPMENTSLEDHPAQDRTLWSRNLLKHDWKVITGLAFDINWGTAFKIAFPYAVFEAEETSDSGML